MKQLDNALIERFMAKAITDKTINTFLGFIEGLVLDGSINEREIDALIGWNDAHPEVLANPPFDVLLSTLNKIVTKDGIDLVQKERFLSLVQAFKSEKYYKGDTTDIQRLHGMLAGIACDCTLVKEELIALNQWLKDHDYLEDDIFYQDVFRVLRPVRTKKDFSDADIASVLKQIKKHVDVENHGLIKQCVDSNDNPDFYKGLFNISSGTYCFTGASARYSKKQWKALVESNGGIFVDDMTQSVDYLVICNKGNKAWAHVSYGRKFEDAKKLQAKGGKILILTEDDFLATAEALSR